MKNENFKFYVQQTLDIPDVLKNFKLKKVMSFDLKKARDWFEELEKNYSDYKFILGKHKYMYTFDPFDYHDDSGEKGHRFMQDQWNYNLCFKDPKKAGPIPIEMRSMVKEEWKDDLESEELNPRDIFTGYMRELIDNLSQNGVRSKHWCVSGLTPGSIISKHKDSDYHMRLHFPLYAEDSCIWTVDGDAYTLEPGYGYLLNTTLLHSVDNSKGKSTRIHVYGKLWTEDCIRYWNLN